MVNKIKFQEIDGTMVIPEYIGTDFNCMNFAAQANWAERNPSVVLNYFSEYSSLNFFVTITNQQIHFQTYSRTGTPKPNLIFYAQDLPSIVIDKFFDYFNVQNLSVENISKLRDSNKLTLMLEDKTTQNFDEKWGGDKFPLTLKEGKWLIERNLKIINEISKVQIEFNQDLLAPIFFNMCNNQVDFDYWKSKYPEILKHNLIY